MPLTNDDYAVYAAMMKAGFRRKQKLAPAAYARRLALEKHAQQRRYCDAFSLWRSCRRSECRRHQCCCGEAQRCLKRALDRVPQNVTQQARQSIVASVPGNIGAPEREARLCAPGDCFD